MQSIGGGEHIAAAVLLVHLLSHVRINSCPATHQMACIEDGRLCRPEYINFVPNVCDGDGVLGDTRLLTEMESTRNYFNLSLLSYNIVKKKKSSRQ